VDAQEKHATFPRKTLNFQVKSEIRRPAPGLHLKKGMGMATL